MKCLSYHAQEAHTVISNYQSLMLLLTNFEKMFDSVSPKFILNWISSISKTKYRVSVNAVFYL